MTRLILLALLFAPVLHAATYIVPSDAELIQKADQIIVATGIGAVTERNPRGGIVTRYTLRVDEVLKGDALPGDFLVLTELGGSLDGRFLVLPGSPRYEAGIAYLVFTSTNRDLEPATSGMALGQFHLERRLAVRRGIGGFDWNLEPHVEPVRDAQRFASYIRDVVAQRGSVADYFVSPDAPDVIESAAPAYTRNSYLLEDGGPGYRWKTPSADFVRNGTQPGSDGALAVANGLEQWSSTDSDIDYRNAGTDSTALGGLDVDDGRNTVLFNDPNGEIADDSNVVGMGGAFGADGTYQFEGETFIEIIEGDVVVANQPFSQNCLDTIVAHELGHSLGIRHSNHPPAGMSCGTTAQCTSDAIMNSSIQCVWNGQLKTWDHDAAAAVYGDGVSCLDVTVVHQPQSQTVPRGEPFDVAVTATGTEPLFYEWFEGERGDTTDRIANAVTRILSVNRGRDATTKFWVRVSNACSSVDSDAATVTIPPQPAKRRAIRH